MIRPRIIVSLLLRGEGLVKGIKFKNHSYVGDPINAVRIYNTKEVDELLFLNILSHKNRKIMPIELVQKIADECYMPFGVGGGISTIDEIRMLLSAGAEKVAINTSAILDPDLIKEAANIFGNQSIIVSIDVKSNWRGKYEVYTHCGTKGTKLNPVDFAVKMESYGAGEILLNSIEREGTTEGYDIQLIQSVSDAVTIPVIASGGAGKNEDFVDAVKNGHASAVAAGSMFVFHGRRRAVLINYPTKEEVNNLFNSSVYEDHNR